MSRRASRTMLGLVTGASLCGVAHADRPEFGAFMELKQLVDVQLHGDGFDRDDDVTYTELSGQLTARIRNRRVVASGTYRLIYRIPETGDVNNSISHDGVMRLQANLINDWLTMETGAIITRSRIDPSGAAPQLNSANLNNLTQTYSVFVEPTLSHRFGDVTVAGRYRYAYTQNESHRTTVPIGPVTNRFDSSHFQQANLSLGMVRTALPFDWNISSEYRHENTTNLAQHYRSINVLAEVKVPVLPTVALVTSGGYERTRTSERDPLIDPVTGLPVLDRNGRFVVDPASPRFLTYDVDGLIADGGVIWKPSRRTRLEARAGYRFGGLSVTGLLEMKPSEKSGLTFIVTDRIDSFAQSVSTGLASSPADLDLGQSLDPGNPFQNCLFGKAAGSGRCIGGALGLASANIYRERAASVIFKHRVRRWTLLSSLGYSHRRYIDRPGTQFSLLGVVDEIYFGDMKITGQLSQRSGVTFSFAGNLFKNGQVGASDVTSGSIGTDYYRTFGRGIRAQAGFAVEATKQDGITADVSGRAQLGVQYQF